VAGQRRESRGGKVLKRIACQREMGATGSHSAGEKGAKAVRIQNSRGREGTQGETGTAIQGSESI